MPNLIFVNNSRGRREVEVAAAQPIKMKWLPVRTYKDIE